MGGVLGIVCEQLLWIVPLVYSVCLSIGFLKDSLVYFLELRNPHRLEIRPTNEIGVSATQGKSIPALKDEIDLYRAQLLDLYTMEDTDILQGLDESMVRCQFVLYKSLFKSTRYEYELANSWVLCRSC